MSNHSDNIGEGSYGGGVVEKAVQERDYAFSALLDNTGEVALLYEVRATPTVYLIDRQGKLVASAVGARPWTVRKGGNWCKRC